MKRRYLSAIVAAFGIAIAGPLSQAHAKDEAFYEEDAWYDVSEWFDGNDYNPTEEAIWRWDDEVWDVADARTEEDAWDFGYDDDTAEADRWYYDYNDYAYSDWSDLDGSGMYEYSSQYYDTDNDGLYDAFASFYDSDGDGFYEDVNYYSFTDTDDQSSRQQARSEIKSRRANVVTLDGEVDTLKEVQTRSGKALVVRLKDTSSNNQYAVDLGPVDSLATKPQKGDALTATGPVMKFGDIQILFTQQLEMNGEEFSIDRSAREFKGKLVSMKDAKLMGQQHRLAKLETKDGKSLMVDFGRKDRLETDFSEGDQVTVTGPAIHAKERRMLVAKSVTHDGNEIEIERAPAKK